MPSPVAIRRGEPSGESGETARAVIPGAVGTGRMEPARGVLATVAGRIAGHAAGEGDEVAANVLRPRAQTEEIR